MARLSAACAAAAMSPQNAVALPAPAQGPTECRPHEFVAPPARYRLAVEAARRAICGELAPELPGIQVAVAVGGTLVWSEGYGDADAERRVPVDSTTAFRIGSVSKPLTADAVALLVQQGKFELDRPIQAYVPSFPRKQWPVTPRELGGHLAGIRGYLNDFAENHSDKYYPTVTAGLDIFAADPLLFEPKTRFSYSTYGYSLLSAAIEDAAGKPFPAFMESAVLKPLGLSHTRIDCRDCRIPDRAQAYERDDRNGTLSIAPHIDLSYKWAGGGYLSTAEDLVRFGSAHLSPGRLSPGSLKLLFTSMRTTDGKQTGYGLGWYVSRDARGHRIASHTGSAIGGSSILLVDRDSKVVFAMAANVTGTDEVGRMLSPVWSEIPEYFNEAVNPKPRTRTERDILALEEKRRTAILNGDVAALDELIADDFVETTASPELRTKAQNLKDLATSRAKPVYVAFSDLAVRAHGDTAIVTGRVVRVSEVEGRRRHGQGRYTRVFVKRGGEWKAVAHETSPIE